MVYRKCLMWWEKGVALVCSVGFSLTGMCCIPWCIWWHPSSSLATKSPMWLPTLCSRFWGVQLLLSHDIVKLPPFLRRSLPWWLVCPRTSGGHPIGLVDRWSPICSIGPVVVIDVPTHVHQLLTRCQCMRKGRKEWWTGWIILGGGWWLPSCLGHLCCSQVVVIVHWIYYFPLECVWWWSCSLACTEHTALCDG